jgi:hypothetical protein
MRAKTVNNDQQGHQGGDENCSVEADGKESQSALGKTWNFLSDIFFTVVTLGRWRKYKKTEGAREAFLLSWNISSWITIGQVWLVQNWATVKLVVAPLLKTAWGKLCVLAVAAKEVTMDYIRV